ncbi:hypothetical protein A3A60_02105 [Candidatus Curtissbacteria bacterium RIFCSPLOWO2_01_FULL_42_26]|uniref:Uncharacterized protein n=1 Tax=Candidatus Curtissbacteria bacterium RIFCSPLOWO2_01_FULL_42_26 TaxID=1797729 RepID=A0A1F5HW34_9BACT|nr:MAG: hypothetical protein A3A60_02105 [Candidatus Curtissbacteria bacterium RIFCSPLOWO2_01_FULL_42_26]
MIKSKIAKYQKILKRPYVIAALAIILIALALAAVFSISQIKNRRTPITQNKIQEKLKNHQELSQYQNQEPQIKLLTRNEIRKKRKLYPLIYKDIPTNVYEIRFSQAGSGILLIYDARSDKILKNFSLLEWNNP